MSHRNNHANIDELLSHRPQVYLSVVDLRCSHTSEPNLLLAWVPKLKIDENLIPYDTIALARDATAKLSFSSQIIKKPKEALLGLGFSFNVPPQLKTCTSTNTLRHNCQAINCKLNVCLVLHHSTTKCRFLALEVTRILRHGAVKKGRAGRAKTSPKLFTRSRQPLICLSHWGGA